MHNTINKTPTYSSSKLITLEGVLDFWPTGKGCMLKMHNTINKTPTYSSSTRNTLEGVLDYCLFI